MFDLRMLRVLWINGPVLLLRAVVALAAWGCVAVTVLGLAGALAGYNFDAALWWVAFASPLGALIKNSQELSAL